MGTFGSFTTVRLGIYAAQKGLDVTGNNITNINTPGYTRQRLNQVSLIPSVNDRYASIYNPRIGQGAVIAGVDQIRDLGLDISYRKATSDVGSANTKLAGLNDLATILDEVGKGDLEQDDGVILSQLNDLRDLISNAITGGVGTYDPLIRSSAEALTTFFHSSAEKLAGLKTTYEDKFNQQVDYVNSLLSNIRDLNVSIRNSDIRGDPGLELRDERNRLLDELSQYVKVDVTYSMEPIGTGTEIEKLTIRLATGDKNTLVDGEYAAQFNQDTEILARNPAYDPTLSAGPGNEPYLDVNGDPTLNAADAQKAPNDNYLLTLGPLTDPLGQKQLVGDVGANIGDTDLYGSLQSIRELLTEEGDFSSAADAAMDPDAASKRGIPYYQKMLDSLAFEFATQMNALNQTGLDGAGNLFSISSNTNDDQQTVGGNTITINASNISVSQGWLNKTISIQATADAHAASGDVSNLAKFLALFDEKQSFNPKDIVGDAQGDPYQGTFEDMLLKIQSTLAKDQMATDSVLNNYTITANDIYVDREGVMGVDLNDEATSLMTYQKAYTAACRLLTVMEEALDSLINGTV